MATEQQSQAPATTAPLPDAIEKALVGGDLAPLSTEQRVIYYRHVCESVGLNPFTRPFDYLRLNGKLVLYANKGATDQLRKIYGISITLPNQRDEDGIYLVQARAKDKDGREDEDLGAVPILNLKGEPLANAKMKACTKAKRRVTLSICGLGMLDETEVESIPGAQRVAVEDVEAPLVSPEDAVKLGRLVEALGELPKMLAFYKVKALGELTAADAAQAIRMMLQRRGKMREDLRKQVGKGWEVRGDVEAEPFTFKCVACGCISESADAGALAHDCAPPEPA